MVAVIFPYFPFPPVLTLMIPTTLFLVTIVALASPTVATVPCGTGTYKTGSVCNYCPPGTYNNQPSPPSSCTQAQSGWYASGSQSVNGVSGYGATSQTSCGKGNYQPNQGKPSCITCPAGSICPSDNTVNPQLCSPGEYMGSTGSGANTCPGCPVGTFNNINGATACCPCCAGYFQDQTHQTTCAVCWEHTNPHASYSAPGATSSGQCSVNPIAGYTNPSSCSVSMNNAGKDVCPPTSGGAPPNTTPINKKRAHKCARGYKRCPLYTGLGGFDCVDTTSDPENCGGCVAIDDGVQAPIGEPGTGGVDCTAIADVSMVQCVKSHCVIRSCRKGYMKALDGKTCIRAGGTAPHQPRRRRYHVPSHGRSGL